MGDLRALGLEQGPAGGEENTVSYEIYPAQLGPSFQEAALAALRLQLLARVLPVLQGYVWQRDRFTLQLTTQQTAPWRQQQRVRPTRRGAAAAAAEGVAAAAAAGAAVGAEGDPPHLWGSVAFGDNVEDEWFVVWLLAQLTRAFPVTARVWDNDGEFLLIEAAYALPRWLKPETAQNRVWLHGGALRLVPPPRTAGDPALSPTPTVRQALAAVRGEGAAAGVDTAAPAQRAQQLLERQRLGGYPQRALAQMHRTHVLLPLPLAGVLEREPQLAAAAVEAFYLRDPDDVKAAARMSRFPPTPLALASVALSRCLYAQLALQEYVPPRGWPMPMPSDPQFKAAELGAKLAAGFEMVCAHGARYGEAEAPQQQQQQEQGAAGSSGNGSSTQPSHTEEAPAESYAVAQAYVHATAALAAPASRVAELLQEAPPPSLPPPEVLPPPDSEAWLQEAAGEVEAELAQRQAELAQHAQRGGRRQGAAAAPAAAVGAGADVGGEEGDEFDAGELATRLRAFVDMAAGLEGAELPPGGVSLDEERFAAELRRALRMDAGDLGDWGSESSDDEGSSFYGGGSSGSSEGGGSDDEGMGSQDGLEQQQQAAAVAPGGQQQAGAHPSKAAAAAAAARRRQQQEQWEAGTATDSDDEAGGFEGAYAAALDTQLAGSAMARTFARAPPAGAAAVERPEAGGSAQGAAAAGEEGGNGEGEAEVGLRPVDVDLNLVESLLASYAGQQGMPGPASTLAGLLGMRLPDDAGGASARP